MKLGVRPFDRDVGLVLASFVALLALENLVVGIGWRAEVAGAWEMAVVRTHVGPLALAASIPFAIALVAVGRLIAARNARVVGALATLAGAAVGIGVTNGRHFASLAVRVPFVAVVALVACAIAVTITRRAPLERSGAIAAAGIGVAALAWLADIVVLPRLYPAFHAALFGIVLAGWALVVLPLRSLRAAPRIALAAIAFAGLCLAWSPRAARGFASQDNLRRLLVEHAPLLGRSVVLAARIDPPPPVDEDGAASTVLTSVHAQAGKSLDWSGRDIVLVTVDALRADHVGAYGYPRPTTPNIDRLAARGARFTHAYCPTPHTSYSVSSMMAGKYMRPLLAMGAADDAETWPMYLRRYGFRTAAFYPPAVFFIDEHRFRHMKETGLGFEYKKEEFAAPALRRTQIEGYLAGAKPDKPLFLWVHLFEPHEPYEMHPEHPFSGDERVDAYDSEVATADALVGDIVALVEKRRPGAVVIVSADHGEELGDHGGRYHGTTVYEEQVRVPLVVVGPGIAPRVVATPVQTIDLLPTTLAALDIPLPARLRGRDLGALLAGKAPPDDEGLAFAETDDYTMLARGADRLVCARKAASCTLFDVAADPAEKRPVLDRPDRARELKKLTAAIERENGKLEASAVPEALRRCLQGSRDAAEEVASLLDDARAEIRRDAARCALRLRANEIAPQLRRAAARDEDARVRDLAALALARIGEPTTAAEALLHGGDPELRVAAALVLAERGDARGEGELVARWTAAFVPGARQPGELEEARELLAALAKIRAKTAVPALVRSLEDVRLRPYVVDALGAIGDARAKEPLLETFASERYLNVRSSEAKALVALGAKEELRAPLARFAGVPEPMTDALAIAESAGLLTAKNGGWSAPTATAEVMAEVRAAPGRSRLLVRTEGPGTLSGTVDDRPIVAAPSGDLWIAEIEDVRGPKARLSLAHATGIRAAWLVPRAAEIPPPPPEDWDAGAVP